MDLDKFIAIASFLIMNVAFFLGNMDMAVVNGLFFFLMIMFGVLFKND